jgi:radical SAM protein with 4Fe4S-binding SPASM domain
LGLLEFVRRHAGTLLPFLTPRKAANASLAVLERRLGRTVVRSRPFMYRIDPCSLCNLRCPSCASHTAETDEQRLMRLDDFRTIVDRVQRWALRASLYDMGEPLLNKRIWSMIRYCTDRGISTLISTNFNLFKPHDVDALFDSGLTVLEPCLDGYTQEAYATYRRNGDVETVKNNIRLVMEEKRRRDATYPLVDAQVVLFEHLVGEFDRIGGFLTSVGVDKVTLRPENLGFVAEPAVEASTGSAYHAEAKTKPGASHRCHWLYVGMMLRPDGNAYPCCGLDFDRFAYGNILEQSLDEIWNNDYYQFSRALFQEGEDLPFDERMVDLPCYECDRFKISRTMQGRGEAIAARAVAAKATSPSRRTRMAVPFRSPTSIT